MANVGGGHDDKDRRVSMKACLLKKVYENLTDWRSKRLASIFHDGPVWGWSALVASRLF
jgi:hypothetical protein